MNFAELLAAANETKTGRSPGQWTPAVCRVWREAEPEAARLLEAALAWELAVGRRATPADGRGNGCGEGQSRQLGSSERQDEDRASCRPRQIEHRKSTVRSQIHLPAPTAQEPVGLVFLAACG
jgi:hypothetical protein